MFDGRAEGHISRSAVLDLTGFRQEKRRGDVRFLTKSSRELDGGEEKTRCGFRSERGGGRLNVLWTTVHM